MPIAETKGRFCVVPFMSLNTRGHGEAQVCCTISGLTKGIPKNAGLADIDDASIYAKLDKFNLKKDSVADFWNSKFMRDFRIKMLKGERIKQCKDCWRLEDSGLSSKRLSRNKVFLEDLKREGIFEKCRADHGYLQTMPRWWEVRLSTKCNLSCYMCCPMLSSKIYNEFLTNKNEIGKENRAAAKMNTDSYQAKEPFLSESAFFKQQFFRNIDSVTHLEMRGGEALFDKQSVEFLIQVASHPRSKHIHFDLSTNGTILTESIISALNRFKSGKIRFSIDAYGKENEYIRYHTKWPVVVKTLLKSKKLKKELLKLIQVTLTVFQICTIHKLLWYIDSLIKAQKDNFFFSFSLVRGTPHLVHELIPLEMRRKSADKVRRFFNHSYMCNKHEHKIAHRKAVQGLIRAILSETVSSPYSKRLFFARVPPLDKIRRQNYLKVFPHLQVLQDEYLHSCERKNTAPEKNRSVITHIDRV